MEQRAHPRHDQPLKISGFAKLSLVLCLANFIVMARLHMFDESTTTAQQFFNKKIKLVETNENVYYVPTVSSFQDMATIFTEINMERGYLLPLVFEISTLCVALASVYLNRIYINLLICVASNLVSFLFLWINNQDLFLYRTTFLVQAMLVYPMLLTSSFSLVRLLPQELAFFKSYYACLMFLLPQFGIPFSYWLLHNDMNSESTPVELLYGASLKLVTFGTLILCFALFIVIESKTSIYYTLESRLTSALESATMNASVSQMSQMQVQRDFMKDKLQMEIRPQDLMKREANKVFQRKEMAGIKMKHLIQRISREKLGLLVMTCGVAMSIGKQLPQLKKQMLTNLIETQSNPQIEIALKRSSSDQEFLTSLLTILVTLLTIALIRRKKIQILKLISTCDIIGYSALILLFIIANRMITPSLWMIQKLIIVGRVFFMAFLMPCVFYVQESGMDVVEGVSILFLVNWACELILRIFLLSLEVQAKIFVLTVIAVICCYIIEKIYKEQKELVEAETQYGKIGDDIEMEIETAIREDEPQKEVKVQKQPQAKKKKETKLGQQKAALSKSQSVQMSQQIITES